MPRRKLGGAVSRSAQCQKRRRLPSQRSRCYSAKHRKESESARARSAHAPCLGEERGAQQYRLFREECRELARAHTQQQCRWHQAPMLACISYAEDYLGATQWAATNLGRAQVGCRVASQSELDGATRRRCSSRAQDEAAVAALAAAVPSSGPEARCIFIRY